MNAKICDRCGEMWVDAQDCDVIVKHVILSGGTSHSDKIGSWDLCNSCMKGLLEYLEKTDNKQY